jgi:hypothetical protein
MTCIPCRLLYRTVLVVLLLELSSSLTAAAAAASSITDDNSCAAAAATSGETNCQNHPSTADDPWLLSTNVNSHSGNYDDFWAQLDCDAVFAKDEQDKGRGRARPIHDQSTWVLLRGIYQGIVGPSYSSLDETRMSENGFEVKVKAEEIAGKGRGVVALEDIPKGTVVWDSYLTARFPSAVEYRRFLASLPRELACDVMIWAYAENYSYKDDENDDGFVVPPFLGTRTLIGVDLDEGSFMNTKDDSTPKNIENRYYTAIRLIKAGEELIVDYADFEKAGSWEAAGFGSDKIVLEEV